MNVLVIFLAALDPLLVPQAGHATGVTAVSFFPGSQRFVTAGADHSLRTWHAPTGFETSALRKNRTPINVVDVSADGRLIATGGQKELVLYDGAGKYLRTIEAHSSAIYGVALSPDGSLVATGGYDGDVKLWRVKDGVLVHRARFGPFDFRGIRSDETENVRSVRFTPDGKSVIAGGGSGFIAEWSTQSGALVNLYTLRDAQGELLLDAPTTLAPSRDGRWLVCSFGPFEKDIYVLDWMNKAVIHRIKGNGTAAEAVAITPDGRYVVASWPADGGADTRVIDRASGKVVRSLVEGRLASVKALAVSPDSRSIVTVGSGVVQYDLQTGQVMQRVGEGSSPIYALSAGSDTLHFFSSDGTLHGVDVVSAKRTTAQKLSGLFAKGIVGRVAIGTSGRYALGWDYAARVDPSGTAYELSVWDAQLGTRVQTLDKNAKTSLYSQVVFGPDERTAYAIYESDGVLQLTAFLVSEARVLWRQRTPERRAAVAVSKRGDLLAVATESGVSLIDAGTGQTVAEIGAARRHSVHALAFSPDGKWLAVGGGDRVYGEGGELELIEVASRRRVATFEGHETAVTALAFDESSTRLVSGSGSLYKHEAQALRVWDLQTRRALAVFAAHSSEIVGVAFVRDHVWSASTDASLRVQQLAAPGYATLLSSTNDWVIYDDEGNFDGSPGCGRMVAVSRGDEVFALDQFAVQRNRPDLLLARVGLGSAEMMAHYRAQFDRRLRKLGMEASTVTTSADAGVRARIDTVEVRGRQLKLSGSAEAAKGLRAVQIYVNDVPLFGVGGLPKSGQRVSVHHQTLLGSGSNKIELSAVDTLGRESLRELRTVLVSDPSTKPALYFLGFGVSRYSRVQPLEFAHQDAIDLGNAFSKLQGFSSVKTKVLLDEEVSVDSIRQARRFVSEARPEDVLIVFVAGHGMHDADSTYYYLTRDADPGRLAQTAASFELIEDLLLVSPARSKLMLMDTCESGELDDLAPAAPAGSKALALASRGLHKLKSGAPALAAFVVTQKDRYIYNDLARRSGAVVFSSSRGGELSYEKRELQNGLFTESILRGLSDLRADRNGDRRVSLDELRKHVMAEVISMSDGLQHPTVDRDNLFVNLAFEPTRAAR